MNKTIIALLGAAALVSADLSAASAQEQKPTPQEIFASPSKLEFKSPLAKALPSTQGITPSVVA